MMTATLSHCLTLDRGITDALKYLVLTFESEMVMEEHLYRPLALHEMSLVPDAKFTNEHWITCKAQPTNAEFLYLVDFRFERKVVQMGTGEMAAVCFFKNSQWSHTRHTKKQWNDLLDGPIKGVLSAVVHETNRTKNRQDN